MSEENISILLYQLNDNKRLIETEQANSTFAFCLFVCLFFYMG